LIKQVVTWTTRKKTGQCIFFLVHWTKLYRHLTLGSFDGCVSYYASNHTILRIMNRNVKGWLVCFSIRR
jgi:hypothetical protein